MAEKQKGLRPFSVPVRGIRIVDESQPKPLTIRWLDKQPPSKNKPRRTTDD